MCPITEAVEALAQGSCVEERGAIYTRPKVVDFIIDLVGYTSSSALCNQSLLEPSFGHDEFLIAAVSRLLDSAVSIAVRTVQPR